MLNKPFGVQQKGDEKIYHSFTLTLRHIGTAIPKKFRTWSTFVYRKANLNRLLSLSSSLFDLSSDHSLVFIHLYKRLLNVPHKCFLSKTNWSQFKATLNINLNDNVSSTTEDDNMDAIELFTKNVQAAVWSATPENVQPKSHSVKYFQSIKRQARKK